MIVHKEDSDIGSLTIRHRVEHVDTDASGVMHFSRYASLIETAALEKLEERGAGLLIFQELGLGLLVHELRIKYLAPAYFRNDLFLGGVIEYLGPMRIRLMMKILRENIDAAPSLLAVGNLEVVVVNRKSLQPVPVPDKLRTLLGENRK